MKPAMRVRSGYFGFLLIGAASWSRSSRAPPTFTRVRQVVYLLVCLCVNPSIHPYAFYCLSVSILLFLISEFSSEGTISFPVGICVLSRINDKLITISRQAWTMLHWRWAAHPSDLAPQAGHTPKKSCQASLLGNTR